MLNCHFVKWQFSTFYLQGHNIYKPSSRGRGYFFHYIYLFLGWVHQQRVLIFALAYRVLVCCQTWKLSKQLIRELHLVTLSAGIHQETGWKKKGAMTCRVAGKVITGTKIFN